MEDQPAAHHERVEHFLNNEPAVDDDAPSAKLGAAAHDQADVGPYRVYKREVQFRVADKRKQSLYFPKDMLDDIKAQAARLDRSLSWTVQNAWRAGRNVIARLSSHPNFIDDEEHQDSSR